VQRAGSDQLQVGFFDVILLDVLEETPGVTVCGLTDRRRLEERVPTFSFTLEGWHPRRVVLHSVQSPH